MALAFAVAASANLPSMLYNLFWRRFNTRGAVWSIYGGLISSVGLVIFSPVVSGKGLDPVTGKNLSLLPTSIDISWFPLENPGIVSIPLGFLLGYLGSVTSKEPDAEDRYTELEVRALTGAGAEAAVNTEPHDRRGPSGRPSSEGRPDAVLAVGSTTTQDARRGAHCMSDETLANLSHEERRFEPSADFAKQANLTEDAYDEAEKDRLAFWEKQAERLDWDTKWDQVLDWDDPPFAKWFVGGKINAAYNCVDRHVENGAGDKVAFHWVGEPEDDTRDITYAELKDEVCKAANALVELGVETGDRVAIYMPMIPETVVAMLACARIGAPHTVVFGGFSSDALANRLEDCDAQVVITSDGGYRRGAPSALKPAVDEAAEKAGIRAQGAGGPSYGRGRGVERRPRRVVARAGRQPVGGARVRVLRRRAPALRHVHLRHDRQAQGHPAHHRWLPGRLRLHALGDLRPQARRRRLLVHRRRRLGDRPLLRRLRPARQPGDVGDVRRHPRHPAQGPLVGDLREVRRHDLLHRPDGDPHVHEVGRRHPRQARPVQAAAARLGR